MCLPGESPSRWSRTDLRAVHAIWRSSTGGVWFPDERLDQQRGLLLDRSVGARPTPAARRAVAPLPHPRAGVGRRRRGGVVTDGPQLCRPFRGAGHALPSGPARGPAAAPRSGRGYRRRRRSRGGRRRALRRPARDARLGELEGSGRSRDTERIGVVDRTVPRSGPRGSSVSASSTADQDGSPDQDGFLDQRGRCRGWWTGGPGASVGELVEAALQEVTFGTVGGEVERRPVRLRRLDRTVQSPQQVRADGVHVRVGA